MPGSPVPVIVTVLSAAHDVEAVDPFDTAVDRPRDRGEILKRVGECVRRAFDIFDDPGDHAGEMETSMILHLAPNLALPKEEWGDGTERKNKISAFNEGWVLAERPWSKITEDTGVGNPEKATAEKGKLFFEHICQKMAQLFTDIVRTDDNDLYQ